MIALYDKVLGGRFFSITVYNDCGTVWWKNYVNMLSHFHLIPERHGQTDERTDRIAISILRVIVLTRDKNAAVLMNS